MLVRLALTAGVVACSAALLRMLAVSDFGWEAVVLVVMLVVQLFVLAMNELARGARGLHDSTGRPGDG